MNSLFVTPPVSERTLVNLIYEAALKPDLWRQVLNELRLISNADQCTLFFYSRNEPHKNFATAARINEQTITLFLKDFIEQQAHHIYRQLAIIPEGRLVSDIDIMEISGNDYSTLVGPEYMKNLWPNLRFQAGIVLLRTEHYCAGLGLQNFSDSANIAPENLNRLQLFIPHLMQAIKIRTKLNVMQQVNRNLEAVLNQLQLGVVLLDNRYQIKLINPAAEKALGKVQGINTKSGTDFMVQTTQSQLISATGKARTGKRYIQSQARETCIAYHNGQIKIGAFNLPGVTENTVPEGSRYLLLVQDSARPCKLPLVYLQQAYGITPAEGELIRYLMNGASLAQAATERAITKETARWQLKSILQKTRTHSQSQLSRLVLALEDQ